MSSNGEDLGLVLRVLADHARDLSEVRSGLAVMRSSVGDLRTVGGHYPASVLTHGVRISEREVRIRRRDGHLRLPRIAA